MNRHYSRTGLLLMIACLSGQAMAFLPPEERAAPPPKKPVVASKPAPPARPKRIEVRKPVHHKPHAAKDEGDWCERKGGAFDENGNCVKDLSPEECANLGGAPNAEGICTANMEVCQQKGGTFNEQGECVFK